MMCSLCLALLTAGSCAHTTTLPPAPPPQTSRVITAAGLAFAVDGLKLPGTLQELQLRVGGARQYLPLDSIQALVFTGPALEGFRPATVHLVGGGHLRAEVYADLLIEGKTDLGYWVISLLKVERVDFPQTIAVPVPPVRTTTPAVAPELKRDLD